MVRRETRMLLRHYLEQGASKSALARRLGISRDTIHRWIRAGDLDRDLDTAPTPSSGGRDDLRLVPSSICQIFTRRDCQIFDRR